MTTTMRCRRGQALVEFALILPLLMMLLLGVIEFARAWNAKQMLTDASREGARVVAVAGSARATKSDSLDGRVREIIDRAGFAEETAEIDCTYGLSEIVCPNELFRIPTGEIASVRVSLPYQLSLIGRFITLPGSDGYLRMTARMRKE